MTFKAVTIFACAGLIAGAAPVRAAPPQGASGDLAGTLRLIADALRQQGRIDYAGAMHDSADGQDWVNHFNVQASNVTVDAASCRIGFHWTTGVDGKQVQDFDAKFDFSRMQSVALTSMEQDVNRLAANDGHATWTGRITPSIWVVTTTTSDGGSYVADFRDYALADRIVGAMNRAIRLCRGSGKTK